MSQIAKIITVQYVTTKAIYTMLHPIGSNRQVYVASEPANIKQTAK